jgi:hypothetical protein
MSSSGQSRVVGLIGVGFDTDDGHIRITRSDNSQVYMGSTESHHALQKICLDIEKAVRSSGRQLSDYTPEEFMDFIGELY